MKVLTVLGTRPEIIRLSLIIQKLDELATRHILVHTGQNYDARLSEIFFDDLGVRKPDYQLVPQSHQFGRQIGQMFADVDEILANEKPDAVLVLGDTNSALSALLAVKRQIPVFHMEAGNRCFDPLVPEEINRHVIDSVATFNLPYTDPSRENLLREGLHSSRIWVCGNPIFEVLNAHQAKINGSGVLKDLDIRTGHYVLVTTHRAENVDVKERLTHIIDALHGIADQWELPIICSVHPRTRQRLNEFSIAIRDNRIQLCAPFGLFDFAKLEQNARCVLTDSGTVQEECCIFGVPTVTIRQSTERPETVLCGSNVVAGVTTARIVACTKLMLENRMTWTCPTGYEDPDVSTKVANFILGGLTNV